MTKEEYFELERQWEEIDEAEGERTDPTDEWDNMFIRANEARSQHPDWYEEYISEE